MSDPEAEYQAAKEAYLAAAQRLSAAKAAMKPILEAREATKQRARLEMLAKAAQALVDGAARKEVVVIGGRSPSYSDIHSLLRPFWRAVLSHEEIYRENGGVDAEDWEKRVSERALARYQRGIAA